MYVHACYVCILHGYIFYVIYIYIYVLNVPDTCCGYMRGIYNGMIYIYSCELLTLRVYVVCMHVICVYVCV